MKHVFYVIYVLFYTGAVFVTGLFVGQLLERSWTVRRGASSATAEAESAEMAHGVVQKPATTTGKRP